jgi:hypothetical protein
VPALKSERTPLYPSETHPFRATCIAGSPTRHGLPASEAATKGGKLGYRFYGTWLHGTYSCLGASHHEISRSDVERLEQSVSVNNDHQSGSEAHRSAAIISLARISQM